MLINIFHLGHNLNKIHLWQWIDDALCFNKIDKLYTFAQHYILTNL